MKRRCDQVTALIDSERVDAGAAIPLDRQACQDNCVAAGIECHILSRRATANYLADAAVKKVKGPKYRGLQPFEKLREVEPHWAKDENWKIAAEMKPGDLDGTDLGDFLAKT